MPVPLIPICINNMKLQYNTNKRETGSKSRRLHKIVSYSLYSSKTKMPPFWVKHFRMWSRRTKNCENREHILCLSTWRDTRLHSCSKWVQPQNETSASCSEKFTAAILRWHCTEIFREKVPFFYTECLKLSTNPNIWHKSFSMELRSVTFEGV